MRSVVKGLFVFFLVFSVFPLPGNDQVFSQVKKLYFYNHNGQGEQARKILDRIDLEGLSDTEIKEVAGHLFRIGDRLFEEGAPDAAIEYYLKVVDKYPRFWPVVNKLEHIEQNRKGAGVDLTHAFRQFLLMIRNFETKVVLGSILVTGFFFSVLFVFFLFATLLLIRYLRLFITDVLLTPRQKAAWLPLGAAVVLMVWPVLLNFSWVIYPFLFAGLVWGYAQIREKKILVFLWILVMVSAFLYNFSLSMEGRLTEKDFKHVQMVYYQKLYSRDVVENFSDELKTLQAYNYYRHGDFDQALDIINMSSDSYTSKLKYDLLGCINYHFGNFDQALRFFNSSLEMNEQDPAILNNFTLILMKETDPSVVASYEERFPKIRLIRDDVSELQPPGISRGYFWQTVFNLSPSGGFRVLETGKTILTGFLKMSLIYFLVIGVIYYLLVSRLVPRYGESVYCSKCRKILNKAKIHRSYDICDDCYELFFLKDVIFLEAKAIKSKKLEKRSRKMYMLSLFVSLFIPGFVLYFRRKYRSFSLMVLLFVFLLVITAMGMFTFHRLFGLHPMIFGLLGLLTILFYLAINLFTVLGRKNGA